MKKIIVLLTVCLLIAGASLSVAAQVVAPVAALDYNDLDYRVNSKKTATAYMGDVLDSLDGITVSDAEKSYIRYEYDGQRVLYYTKPALIDRQYDYDGENRCLTVTVMRDRYVPQKHDKIVDWIPMTATVGDVTVEFAPAGDMEEGYYRAVFEDFLWTADMTAMVEYRARFEVSAETLNEYVNYAYEQVLLLHDEYSSLDSRIATYRAALAAYEQSLAEWEKYESDSEQYELHAAKVAKYQDYLTYQAYLVKLEEYRVAHEAYLANQKEWAEYYENCSKFEQYLAYKNVQYPNAMNTIQHQLALLALMEKEDPNTGMSFIDMMVDGRIDSLINDKKKRELLKMAVGDGPVNNAIESNTALKNFCEKYQSLTTDQEKYELYIKEYNKVKYENGGMVNDGLAKHLRQLYNSIQTIYNNETVYKTLQKDYPEHITTLVRMLGSLYVQRCVFDDSVTMNLNEVVDKQGNQKASALVHASVRPASDTNKATPLSAWPIDPETFEVKEQPIKPSDTLEDGKYPDPPEFVTVEHEGELEDYMEDPGYMEQPTPPAQEKLPHPGQEPALNWKQTEQDLHEAYLAGKVVQRPAFDESQFITLSVTNQFNIQLDDAERCYYVYFHSEEGKYLGHSLGVKSGEAVEVPAEIGIPEKPSEVQYEYEFAGWVDENGELLDLTCLTEDTDAYASYTAVLRKYNVTWSVDGAMVVEQWAYGTTPVFEGSPDRPRDEQYEYTFIGWDRNPTPVTGDVTYTAQYERTARRYSVTFNKGDGTDPIVKEYPYKQNLAEVVAALSKPYMAPTAQYTYTFAGWKNDATGEVYTSNGDLPQLTENMSFTAVFDSTENSYTVTWVIEGVSTQSTWVYGETPSFGQPDPEKETDERYHYTFAGWDAEIVPVTGDVTYTAEFTSTVRLYRVDFVVEGETFTLELEYGQIPEFDGEPQKAADVQYEYEFTGWDNNPAPVSGDATYVALFREILRKYPVKFIVEGNELVVEFEYGKMPKYPNGMPTKSDDDVYCYVFTDWDKPLAAIDGSEVTYTACFEAVPLAPGADGEKGKLTAGADGKYELALQGTQADLSKIFEKIGEEQAESLEVLFGQAVLVFPKSQIDAFYLMGGGISSVKLGLSEYEGQVAYQLEMLDQSGEPVTYLVSELTVKLPYSSTHTVEIFRAESNGNLTKLEAEYKDGYLVLNVMGPATFVIKEKFRISKNPTENGVFDVIGEAYEGDVITITPDPNEGYHIDEVLIEYDGQQIKIEPVDGKYTFVMPRGDVQVSAAFEVVQGGTVPEVLVGVVTALLIVAVGLVIAVILLRRKTVKA